VTWLVPEYWRAKNENDPKLLRALSTPGLLEAVAKEHPEFASMYKPPDVKDEILTDIAIHILAEGKPALLLLHLVEVDGAQHHTGLWSPESVRAIEEDDRQLARVFHALDVDGLSKDTNVIVASDHGFMNAAHAVRPGTLLREAGLVTLNAAGHVTDWKATLVVNSGSAYAYLHDASDKASLEQLKALFNGKASDPTSGIGRVYGADEVRALGGDPAASLAIEAAPDFMLVEGYAGPFAAPGNYRATHGYDPSRPEMRPSLLMVGPTVPHGTLVDPHLVDIGPTIASWLGLSMAGVDGKVLGVTTTP
jgi:predicted AlkP superfamily pyrophosphatase or phosphodiesterase